MSIRSFFKDGNGKRHSTPSYSRPRKIKRITSETFLLIKGLLRKLKRPRVKTKQHCHKKTPVIYKTANDSKSYKAHAYEPSNISNAYDSDFWRWRRVAEWEKYINDPLENNKWTRYNLVKYTSKP